MITPFDYQLQAIEAVCRSWTHRVNDRVLVTAPTGSGKTIIGGKLIQRILERNPRLRVCVITHAKELIEQNATTFKKLAPELARRVGVFSAGIQSAAKNRADGKKQIVFAGIQSIHDKDCGLFNVIIVDECHLIPRKGHGQYLTWLRGQMEMAASCGAVWRLCGLTATPFRLDGGWLFAEKEGYVFTHEVYKIGILDLIARGRLVEPISRVMETRVDMSGVQTRNGDYVESQMQARFDRGDVVASACMEIAKALEGRNRAIVFCSGIKHAEHVADTLNGIGVKAAMVTGAAKQKKDRAKTLAAYKRGEYRAVVNVGVLTTGFDDPPTDTVAVLRATKSTALWIQMVGRGMRVSPGKTDCLVLDFGANIAEHGPIDDPDVYAKGGGGAGDRPTKFCPNQDCRAELPLNARQCPDCGTMVNPRGPLEPRHEGEAFAGAVISTQGGAGEVWEVFGVDYQVWQSARNPNGPPTLRANFHRASDGKRVFGANGMASAFLAFGHRGKAQATARGYWASFAGTNPPESAQEALERVSELGRPTHIQVKRKGRHYEILRYLYESAGDTEAA